MLEVLVRADFMETTRNSMAAVFGPSLEFKLAQVLAGATSPLQLSETMVRTGSTRRALSPSGCLRRSIERMERLGLVINAGSHRKPLYKLNPPKGEPKLLIALFAETSPDCLG